MVARVVTVKLVNARIAIVEGLLVQLSYVLQNHVYTNVSTDQTAFGRKYSLT